MLFLEAETKRLLEKAKANFSITAEQQEIFIESQSDLNISTVVSKTAVLTIDGILTAKPDIIAEFFGGGNVTYSDINNALLAADTDPKIDAIQLNVNSPGGEVDGLQETINILQNIKKPITAIVGSLAASAAYAIVAQAETIIANTRASGVGSIGVAVSYYVDDSIVEIASTNAPSKRPDVTTESGKAIVRERLDQLELLFLENVAVGRNTTIDKVKTDFGQGGIVFADEALERGMIDKIAGVSAATQESNINNKMGVTFMDLTEFKAEHSEIYNDAIAMGVNKERDRVVAHLTMGEASGDMKTAITAIQEGSEMTTSLQATYMAAGMNKAEQQDRIEDNVEDIATKEAVTKSDAEIVIEKMEALNG